MSKSARDRTVPGWYGADRESCSSSPSALRDWRRRRGLTLRAKLLATMFKAAAVLLFYLQSGNLWGPIALGTLLTGVAIYLWSRPTASRVSRAA